MKVRRLFSLWAGSAPSARARAPGPASFAESLGDREGRCQTMRFGLLKLRLVAGMLEAGMWPCEVTRTLDGRLTLSVLDFIITLGRLNLLGSLMVRFLAMVAGLRLCSIF